MSLVCQFIGHRRSRSRATFDEKRQQWVSCCRRCATVLIRQADGRWTPLPTVPDKLVPVERAPTSNAVRAERREKPPVDEIEPHPMAELEQILR